MEGGWRGDGGGMEGGWRGMEGGWRGDGGGMEGEGGEMEGWRDERIEGCAFERSRLRMVVQYLDDQRRVRNIESSSSHIRAEQH